MRLTRFPTGSSCGKLSAVTVDGRKEPVTVFELRDAKGKSMASAMTSFLDFYTQGLASYKKRDWDEATAFFQHAMTLPHPTLFCQFLH